MIYNGSIDRHCIGGSIRQWHVLEKGHRCSALHTAPLVIYRLIVGMSIETLVDACILVLITVIRKQWILLW